MFKYTKSAVSDTFDLIKRVMHFLQIAVQLIYIAYVAYRIYSNTGHIIINIILLAASVAYILYQAISTREFYTKKQVLHRKTVRRIFKTVKYAANICIIVMAAVLLVRGEAANENATMLMTVFMICGVLASAVFDVLLIMIDRQTELIKSALSYDAEVLKADHEFIAAVLKRFGADIEKMFPPLDDQKTVRRIKDVHHKQKQKGMRKRDFRRTAE